MESTHNDRVKASILAVELFSGAELAQRMIESLYNRHFADYEQKDIDAATAAEIGDTLTAINSILYTAISNTALDLGDGDADLYDRAERRAVMRRVSKLNGEAYDIERTLSGTERDTWDAARTAAVNKPDADAIRELEALISSRKQ